LSLYAKNFPKGSITLGPNRGILDSAMYVVVVRELKPSLSEPIVLATCDKLEVKLREEVRFSGSALIPNGTVKRYTWDFGDGSEKSSEQNPTHAYTKPGSYVVTLMVTDSENRHGKALVGVHAGPTIPPFDPGEDK
jgi:PKD repeat protein